MKKYKLLKNTIFFSLMSLIPMTTVHLLSSSDFSSIAVTELENEEDIQTEIDENPEILKVDNSMLVAGGAHSMFLNNTTGRLYAWGQNDNGQIGNGTTGPDETTPVDISANFDGVDNLKDSYITATAEASYLLTSTGRLFSWGGNAAGQLGTGDTTNRLTPTEITNSGALANLDLTDALLPMSSSSSNHMMLITHSDDPAADQSSLVVWGDNNFLQLSLGSAYTNVDFEATPTLNTYDFFGDGIRLQGNEKISISSTHGLIGKSSYSTGWNNPNQKTLYGLGTGWIGKYGDGGASQGDWEEPYLLQNTDDNTIFNSVFAYQHGTLYSDDVSYETRQRGSGRNSNGQLSYGGWVNTQFTFRYSANYTSFTPKNKNFGTNHGMMLGTDGKLRTWGNGDNGKLGRGNENDILNSNAGDIDDQGDLEQISSDRLIDSAYSIGNEFTTLITPEKELIVWGQNDGTFANGETGTTSNTPVYVGNLFEDTNQINDLEMEQDDANLEVYFSLDINDDSYNEKIQYKIYEEGTTPSATDWTTIDNPEQGINIVEYEVGPPGGTGEVVEDKDYVFEVRLNQNSISTKTINISLNPTYPEVIGLVTYESGFFSINNLTVNVNLNASHGYVRWKLVEGTVNDPTIDYGWNNVVLTNGSNNLGNVESLNENSDHAFILEFLEFPNDYSDYTQENIATGDPEDPSFSYDGFFYNITQTSADINILIDLHDYIGEEALEYVLLNEDTGETVLEKTEFVPSGTTTLSFEDLEHSTEYTLSISMPSSDLGVQDQTFDTADPADSTISNIETEPSLNYSNINLDFNQGEINGIGFNGSVEYVVYETSTTKPAGTAKNLGSGSNSIFASDLNSHTDYTFEIWFTDAPATFYSSTFTTESVKSTIDVFNYNWEDNTSTASIFYSKENNDLDGVVQGRIKLSSSNEWGEWFVHINAEEGNNEITIPNLTAGETYDVQMVIDSDFNAVEEIQITSSTGEAIPEEPKGSTGLSPVIKNFLIVSGSVVGFLAVSTGGFILFKKFK